MFHGLHVCSRKSVVSCAGNCIMFTVCYQLLQLLWGMKIKQADVYVNQKFPQFIDFFNHPRRRQLCSGLQSSDPELLTQGKRQAWALLTAAQPSTRPELSQNLAHKLSLQHSPQLHKEHEKHYSKQIRRELYTFTGSDDRQKQVIKQPAGKTTQHP